MARSFAVLAALALASLLAGCTNEAPAAPLAPPAEPQLVMALPANITFSDTVTLSVMGAPVPAPVGVGFGCGLQNYCHVESFTVDEPAGWDQADANATANATVAITASLAWQNAQHDFDLYVIPDAEGDIHGDARYPPGNTALVEARLPPGDYTVLVMAYFVTQDTFQLDVQFAA